MLCRNMSILCCLNKSNIMGYAETTKTLHYTTSFEYDTRVIWSGVR